MTSIARELKRIHASIERTSSDEVAYSYITEACENSMEYAVETFVFPDGSKLKIDPLSHSVKVIK